MKKLLWRFGKITAALVTIIALLFLFLFIRDLNNSKNYVYEAIADTQSNKKKASDNLVTAFDILYPEESPHWTYIGYLYSHRISFKNEYLNTLVTRVLSFTDREYRKKHPFNYFNRTLEIDYHVHNLDRLTKVNYLFNDATKWSKRWEELSDGKYSGSICESIYGLIHTEEGDEKSQASLFKKVDEAIESYLNAHVTGKYSSSLLACRVSYQKSLLATPPRS